MSLFIYWIYNKKISNLREVSQCTFNFKKVYFIFLVFGMLNCLFEKFWIQSNQKKKEILWVCAFGFIEVKFGKSYYYFLTFVKFKLLVRDDIKFKN